MAGGCGNGMDLLVMDASMVLDGGSVIPSGVPVVKTAAAALLSKATSALMTTTQLLLFTRS